MLYLLPSVSSTFPTQASVAGERCPCHERVCKPAFLLIIQSQVLYQLCQSVVHAAIFFDPRRGVSCCKLALLAWGRKVLL